jgi:hypothetical protein
MYVIKLLSITAFIGSVAWLIHTPDYEPAIACITSLSACIAAFLVDRRKRDSINQRQSVSGKAVGIQSGRDTSTGNITTTKG